MQRFLVALEMTTPLHLFGITSYRKPFDATYRLLYTLHMQYIGRCHNFVFLPVASNDNDDLLALNTPHYDLSLIREIKQQMLMENMFTGMLLWSRKERRFFQEILDAERYIVMRYFTANVKEEIIRALKYYIVSSYLCPKPRRGRKKSK